MLAWPFYMLLCVPFLRSISCDAMFGCFMLILMLSSFDPCCMLISSFLHPCLYITYFPYSKCSCTFLCLSCLVWLHSSPFVACLGATMWVRSHLDDVGLLFPCLPLPCLALHVRASLVSLVCAL